MALLGSCLLLAGLGFVTGFIQHRAGGSAQLLQVGTDTPATAMDRTTQLSSNSPELVADPLDSRFVVMANRVDYPDFSCALQVSGDGGRSWVPADPVPRLPAGIAKCYAPEVAFDAAGRLYYLFVGLAGPGNQPAGAFLTSSADGGRTFVTPRRVLGPLNFAVRMAIDPTMGRNGRIHLVWLHASTAPGSGFDPVPNPILADYSDDGGRSFSRPVRVSDPSRPRAVAPGLALGADHSLDVVYYDLGRDAIDYQGVAGPTWPGTWSLVLARSTDGGGHFGPSEVVDSSIRPPGRVMLIFTMPPPSVASQGDRLCVAWTDARLGDADAMAKCSPNQGSSWQKLVRLNDDPVGDGASQYLPQLSIAPGGRIDAAFFDRRDDPTNVLADVSYAFSSDGGVAFSHNVKLTQLPSSSHIGAQYAGAPAQGQYELGSRLGSLSSSDHVVVAWPDTRNSLPRTAGQDIFTVQVKVLGQPVAAWSRALGAVLVVAGVVMAALALVARARAGRVRA